MDCNVTRGNASLNMSTVNNGYGILCGNSTGNSVSARNGESEGLRIFKLLCYTVVFLMGTVGNSLVVWLVAKRRLRARYNYFLANLAIADLAVVAINLPFRLAYQENDYEWPFGYALCKIIPPLTFTFTTASSAFLTAVSLERYNAVVHPLRTKVTRLHLKLAVICIWILSFVVTLPLNTFMTIKKKTKLVCTDSWPSQMFEQLYFLFLFLIQFAFPLILMLAVYMRVIAKMHNNQLRSCNHRASVHIRRRNKRVIRMLMVVVFAYFICVMPYSIYLVLSVFQINGALAVKKFLVLLLLANSMVNPLLYGALNRQFRIGYMEAVSTVRRTCFRGKKQPTLSSIFKPVPVDNQDHNQRRKKYIVRIMMSK